MPKGSAGAGGRLRFRGARAHRGAPVQTVVGKFVTERYGDYELVKYLTQGGMADLYLARSPKLSQPVVVKKIQTRYVELTRVVKMFIDEGRIAKALEHPNIVRILDVGQATGTYFIVME